MADKLKWSEIYEDFRRRHPNLSKTAVRYVPYGYAEILVYLKDGLTLSYDYETSRAYFNSKPR